MSGRIFGLTWGFIFAVGLALWIGKRYGASIPLLKSI